MKRSLLLFIPAIIALLVFSCKKDNTNLNTVTPPLYASLDDVFARTAPLATTQSIVVSTGGEVISKGGTHIIFPRDAFQSFSGTIITGSVDVKVYDWVKKGDMIFGKVLPVSNNEALNTSGQAYIEVTQNGIPVRLRKGVYARVAFPTYKPNHQANSGDNVYLGQKITGSVNTVNWWGTDPVATVDYSTTDTTAVLTDSFRYIAASHTLPSSGYSNFTVRISAPVQLEQTLAVAILTDTSYGIKSVYPVASAINNSISAQHIPTQMQYFVVMGINKGVFYGGTKLILQPATDSIYQVTVQQVDPQAFRLDLNALN